MNEQIQFLFEDIKNKLSVIYGSHIIENYIHLAITNQDDVYAYCKMHIVFPRNENVKTGLKGSVVTFRYDMLENIICRKDMAMLMRNSAWANKEYSVIHDNRQDVRLWDEIKKIYDLHLK